MSFEGILGNVPALDRLRGLLAGGRRAHAYLFAGPDGVGKKLAAKAFARELGARPLVVERLEDKHEVLIAQVQEVIRPALRAGSDVVCDRYYFSTAAYQGAAGRIGMKTVLDLAEKIARFERPDLVALLDLAPAVARRRAGDRRDRVESKGLAYQNRVRRGFLELARRDRRRIRVIDAARDADLVFADLWKAVDRVL